MIKFSAPQNIAPDSITRAKPLIYLTMLLSVWVVARIIFTLATTQASDADIKLLTPKLADAQPLLTKAAQPINSQSALEKLVLDSDEKTIISNFALAAKFLESPSGIKFSPRELSNGSSFISAASNGLPKNYSPLLFLNALEESSNSLVRPNSYVSNSWDLPAGNGKKLTSLDRGHENDGSINSSLASRLSAYAYIFARSGDGDANALGGRYGGSQAAVQVAYRLNPNHKSVIDATLRAQSALRGSDREIAAGLRLKPSKKFPIALIAERRFRPSNSDGFAIYVAGGKSDVKLPANFKLNTFGQAGLSTAARDTLFFDGQAIAEKSLHKSKKFEILAGAGAWAGGQRGAQRFDIGPSVSVKLSSGQKNYRISGDWRERIGGNASPNSGAAITLSTDF